MSPPGHHRRLRRSSSVAEGKRSEEKGADSTKVSDSAAVDDAKKAPADGEAKLAAKGSSSEEYFSSRRDPDSLDAVAAGTEVAADSLPGEHVDANASVKAGEDNETSAVPELEKEEEKKDKEETTAEKEKEKEKEKKGKSIGNLSVDFKEAISSDEKEVEAPAMEKENTEVARITAEEKNSGESKTAT
ncbi:uncharacterized protein DDB_G0279979-like [Zingiber officinale]|uniref:uncharacterized protein DDB_G0279979-like n=1 Tax=Zingiber officinale TaxID=94328 RepID=UPI001C4DC23D|nr:uncharacterized protein DDB_G0279979-like [Zingiber officinale]